MAAHSSILAWRTPGTGETDGLPSVGSNRVGHDWSDLAAAAAAAWSVVYQAEIKVFPEASTPYKTLNPLSSSLYLGKILVLHLENQKSQVLKVPHHSLPCVPPRRAVSFFKDKQEYISADWNLFDFSSYMGIFPWWKLFELHTYNFFTFIFSYTLVSFIEMT